MQKLKKHVSLLLALIMVFSLFTIVPVTVHAEDGVEYVYRSWNYITEEIEEETKICTEYTDLSARTSDSLSPGWYVVRGDVTAVNRLMINYGEVNLILCDGCTLDAKKGIGVEPFATLNIYGQLNDTGKIKSIKGNRKYDAVIGGTFRGNENESLDTILTLIKGVNSGYFKIHGGTLELESNSESRGAALGGGLAGSLTNVSIYGGKLNCVGYRGAGIGGGSLGTDSNGIISSGYNIYGGIIHAISECGAGIGGGEDSYNFNGSFFIRGGSITSTSTDGGAGIGGGSSAINGSINISGGKVAALALDDDGHTGAGIGSGTHSDKVEENTDAHDINITGGTVMACALSGAGIGGGGVGGTGNINITGGTSLGISLGGGAGIGSGYSGAVKNININNAAAMGRSANYFKDEKNVLSQIENEMVLWAVQTLDFCEGYVSDLPVLDENTLNEIADQQFPTLNPDDYDYISRERFGSGIGCGGEGSVEDITIKNSFVAAQGGRASAGIGSSSDLADYYSKYNNITIENSCVRAKGGDDVDEFDNRSSGGAGIGGGEKSYPKEGTKTVIKDSAVVAVAGGGSAGIGSGRDSEHRYSTHGDEYPEKYLCNIEISSSRIFAKGGNYAAGIGGGENTSSESIRISSGSDIQAFGGKDAAAIGGGQDGNGGTISISSSDVYAEGGRYGAGIGGGEDAGVKSISILNQCNVEAIGGSSGNGCAIGHGGYNKFAAFFTGNYPSNGSLRLDSSQSFAKVGEDKDHTVDVSGSAVKDAIREKKYVYLYECPHENTECRAISEFNHANVCTLCGQEVSSGQHEWNSEDKCISCGATRRMSTIKLIEEDSNGTVERNITIPWGSTYMLTEPENTPDGKTFAYWSDTTGGDMWEYGEEVEIFSDTVTYRAIYLHLVETSYLDEDGYEQTETARRLELEDYDNDDDDYLSNLQSGWYVLDQNITEGGGNYLIYGDVNLILADGVTLSSDDIRFFSVGNDNTFTVYGQTKQTGTIDKSDDSIGVFGNYVQYGGVVKTGELTADNCKLLGGNFEADAMKVDSTIELGWILPNNSIKIGDYTYSNQYSPAVSVTEDQKLRYEQQEGAGRYNTITGELTENDIRNIRGKELIPEQRFEYHSRPTWTWSDDLSKATATFIGLTSAWTPDIDVKADVTRVDEGETLKATATVYFRGEEYTDTQSKQIRWKVYSNTPDHGTVTIKDSPAAPDEFVEIVAVPEKGYGVGTVTMEPFDSSVELKYFGNSGFVMPECNVNVNVTFVRTDPYTVTIGSSEHGTVTADKEEAMEGDTVTLTAAPDNGYMLQAFTVRDEDDHDVTVTDGKFTMPDSNVTVSATFTRVPYVAQVEPYIDENGAYILGAVEHYVIDGKNYAVNEDESVGEELSDISLSYFDFKLREDDTYQIEYYTGPEIEDQLIIPKTFKGKSVTVLGNDSGKPLYETNKSQFELVLNENITEIKPYAFNTLYVTKVTGDTSRLNKLGDYAFSRANSPDDYTLDIKLDYPGIISVGNEVFDHMKVTARVKHTTIFSNLLLGSQSIDYIFTDPHPYGDPVWTWGENNTSASARFTCTETRCRHEELVDATITRGVKDGRNVLIATAEIDGNTYTDTKEFNYFAYYSLTLGGDIGVNFYLDLTDEELEKGVCVDFTWNGKNASATFDSTSVKDAKTGCYKATCYVCAAEMSDMITAAITFGDDEAPIATQQYSVRDYALVIINNKEGKFSDELITLVKTMLNYGTSAQIQFDHNLENAANAGVDYAIEKLTQDELASINSDVPDKDAMSAALDGKGIEYYGYSLLLKTKTTLRFYFKKNGTDISALSLLDSKGKNVGAIKDYNADYGYIEVTGIPASKLGENYELKYGDVSLGSFSAFSYVKDILLNVEDRVTEETVTTLYRYNEAAIEYFNSVA